MKKNFFDFVNACRVEEFKRQIFDKKNKDYTMPAIAFQSGFNSRSSFYDIFKKQCGMTPGEYKHIQQSKNMGKTREDCDKAI